MNQGIFVSYRREDDLSTTWRIHDGLVSKFGAANVYIDKEKLTSGDFTSELMRLVARCDVMLVIVGPQWERLLKERNEAGGVDHVREEIKEALARGLLIIPLLLGQTPAPNEKELPDDIRTFIKNNGVRMPEENLFREGMDRLEAVITKHRRRLSDAYNSYRGSLNTARVKSLLSGDASSSDPTTLKIGPSSITYGSRWESMRSVLGARTASRRFSVGTPAWQLLMLVAGSALLVMGTAVDANLGGLWLYGHIKNAAQEMRTWTAAAFWASILICVYVLIGLRIFAALLLAAGSIVTIAYALPKVSPLFGPYADRALEGFVYVISQGWVPGIAILLYLDLSMTPHGIRWADVKGWFRSPSWIRILRDRSIPDVVILTDNDPIRVRLRRLSWRRKVDDVEFAAQIAERVRALRTSPPQTKPTFIDLRYAEIHPYGDSLIDSLCTDFTQVGEMLDVVEPGPAEILKEIVTCPRLFGPSFR